MSEPKRVVPQSLEFPDSLGHATKKEKKREKGKQLAPSYRFTIALPESNENSYSEINWAQLVKSEEKKRRKEDQRVDDESATNGLGLFDDGDDDEDKLKEMAKRLEAKYGTGQTGTAGRKRHKYDDYVDLGAGYDENDSFIDNTDAYDEIVPGEVTTAYGGFYINSGPLEFKPTDGNSPVHSRLNNNNNNEEESSSDSGDEDEDEGSRVLKRMEKRIISSSEDDEDEDNVGDPPRKKYKPDENGDKKLNNDNGIKKKRKLQPEPSNQQSDDCELLNSRKNPTNDDKREILDLECSSEDQEERKRAKYDVVKTKGDKKKFDIKSFVKKSSTNGLDLKKIDLKKFGGKDSNIDDAIESVVNAGRVVDESSTDTMDSGKSRVLAGTESDCDDMDKEETPLPEPLPDDIKDIINKLKTYAEKHKDGKGKFFDDYVNATLLALDEKLRMINSPSARLLTYGHLANFLPCSKVSLVNRAKTLCIQDAEKRLTVPIQRLKVIIDGMMPAVIERHAKECQRVADEKGLENSPVEGESSDAEAEKSKIPRKKFPWSSESKKLVQEIASARRHYFKVRKPRKENFETFLGSFMESKVLPLWPGGWMTLRALLKYANPEPVEKRKQKKLRDATVPNSIGTASVQNSTLKPESSNAIPFNSVTAVSQDRAKSPTNLSKTPSETATNFTITSQSVKSSDSVDRKPSGSSTKHRDKNNESPVTILGHQENASSANSQGIAKITVVPTAQLMAQKPVKSITEKFNPMDLTSSSLSITPVNDYQKTNKLPSETKKDVISITPYNESTGNVDNVVISSSAAVPSSRSDAVSYTLPNSSGTTTKSASNKCRHLQENTEATSEKRTDERTDGEGHKNEKKEKKRDRWPDDKHRSHDSKKRRKEHKSSDSSAQQQQQSASTTKPEVSTISTVQSSLSKEEQEQRQIEETMAATNFLSQIINDDSPRPASEKRKEPEVVEVVEENIVNPAQQPSEHDNDVQMVMRSLKELRELQEMKYSPSHSPGVQKASKSSNQYVGYQDDYPRLYNKKDDKMRVGKEESPW